MVCKDWEKGKKLFLIVCCVLVVAMMILGIVIITLKRHSFDSGNNDSLNPEKLEFSGPAYKPSSVYDDSNKEITLSDFSDKPMALIFFNTTNEESLNTLRIFGENENDYSEKINIIGVCVSDGVSENIDTVKDTLTQNSITLNNILYDLDYFAKNEYNITTIPSLVFINKNHEIINTITNDIDEDVITANLDILAENY